MRTERKDERAVTITNSCPPGDVPMRSAANETVETRLREHISRLADPRLGGRVPGTEGSRLARAYITSVLGTCKNITCRKFEGTGTTIIGTWNPNNYAEYILVSAHYDHISHSPGAGDNAAAVAILLELAYHLDTTSNGNYGVLLAFFDCEEPPYFRTSRMGSTEFYEHDSLASTSCIKAALVMDLLGHWPRVPLVSKKLVFVTGAENEHSLYDATQHEAREASSTGNKLTPIAIPNDVVGDMSDHHVFNEHDIPFLFFSAGYSEHYHAASDTVANIDHEYVNLASKTITSIVGRLLQVDSWSFDRDAMLRPVRVGLVEALRANGIGVSEYTLDRVLNEIKHGFV
jgi:Zn-dependent M28 family amino/carboxypeptidase